MAYEHREGQGSLFKNTKTNDRQPDFKGTINIKGVTYEVSGWSRTSQNGREYISLQAQEQSSDPAGRRPASQAPAQPSRPSYGQSQYTPREQYQPSQPAQAPVAPDPTIDDMPAPVEYEDLPF